MTVRRAEKWCALFLHPCWHMRWQVVVGSASRGFWKTGRGGATREHQATSKKLTARDARFLRRPLGHCYPIAQIAAERTSSFFDVHSGSAHVLISSTSLLFRRISGRVLVPHHGELPAQATSAEVQAAERHRTFDVSEAQHKLDRSCPGAFPDEVESGNAPGLFVVACPFRNTGFHFSATCPNGS
jgi:hypothetical protein